MSSASPARRTVLTAAGATPAALALAACGGSPEDGGAPAEKEQQDTGPEGTQRPEEGTGDVLVEASDVPEGGGTILQEEKVVVTQPSAGDFKAFSAVCQHQGCLVSSVADGTINCACHGSKYAIADGSVTQGPASRALPGVDVSVTDGAIRRK
ncbi:Rieske (2Fe-2S) protein [Streptomyces sp. TR06-5]|uniref:Rieske (2Fe-2S) protein n=1 Tax=Streptomyces sp. TR06-5 TaxID=3385976 RepID=UPI0039A30A14